MRAASSAVFSSALPMVIRASRSSIGRMRTPRSRSARVSCAGVNPTEAGSTATKFAREANVSTPSERSAERTRARSLRIRPI